MLCVFRYLRCLCQDGFRLRITFLRILFGPFLSMICPFALSLTRLNYDLTCHFITITFFRCNQIGTQISARTVRKKSLSVFTDNIFQYSLFALFQRKTCEIFFDFKCFSLLNRQGFGGDLFLSLIARFLLCQFDFLSCRIISLRCKYHISRRNKYGTGQKKSQRSRQPSASPIFQSQNSFLIVNFLISESRGSTICLPCYCPAYLEVDSPVCAYPFISLLLAHT